MTASVNSMAWILGGRKEDGELNHHLVTRGSGSGRAHGAIEWSATRLELGLNYLSNSDSANRELLDLNFPLTSVPDELAEPQAAVSSAVCTLEKVKIALERAEREGVTKQQKSAAETSNSLSSTTTLLLKRRVESSSADGGGGGEMIAVGCTRCFMLVLVPKSEPTCPQCTSHVSLPLLKKPRFDLNSNQD